MATKQGLGARGITFLIVFAGSWFLPAVVPKPLQLGPVDAMGNDQAIYGDYATVLKTYVNDEGIVNYGELKTHPDGLHAFAETIGKLDPKVYEGWREKDKIAFWINAYNALTLNVIVENYPIKSSFIAALRYPKNSIRQIPGVWDKVGFPVMEREATLDFIEHGILRKQFNEPQIHMALVCTAMGCPPLRNEPFTGNKLDAQLDDQTRRLLGNPEKFRIVPSGRRVYLSLIFKWFGDDFVRTYGTDAEFAGHTRAERAVLNFITQYLDEGESKFLARGEFSVKCLNYDWTLNEQ